jgi:hypothetical protein
MILTLVDNEYVIIILLKILLWVIKARLNTHTLADVKMVNSLRLFYFIKSFCLHNFLPIILQFYTFHEA